MWISLGLFASLLALSHALYSPSDDVVELNPSNFNKLVLNGEELWLIEFYAPWCGHCKSLAPEWKKAASALKGVVKVGAVDMDAHQSVGGPYNVRGFPTIKVFGTDKNSPTDYNGARTAQSIVDTAMSELKSMVSRRLSGKAGGSKKNGGGGGGGGGRKPGNEADVVEVTDSNFEDEVLGTDDLVLVEFFAPWCGHCKNLAPEWASAATQLKGKKIKIAALDATVNTVMASRYGVRGYPTIKMFPAGSKDGQAVDYDGGRTASDIVAYALDKLAENIPAPEVVQLIDEAALKDGCEEHQLCLISFLPHILDCQSDCRNGHIELLATLAEKYKKRMWGWLWAEAGAQPEVEDALGIGGFGYPALAALNTRKMKYTWLRGSFSESGLTEFLRELAVGRGSTAPIKNAQLPQVIPSDPWDGQDGEIDMPEEEDIDLSDVELDDLDDIDVKKIEL